MDTSFLTRDVGRQFTDSDGENPRVDVQPLAPLSWTASGALFRITRDGETVHQPVWYSHLALLKLIKHYEFRTVLDIGTNDGMVSYVFDALGKEAVGLEPAPPWQNHPDYPCREVDIDVDYMSVQFIKKFDAIWCSHVLEHVRNPGNFLDKIFDDLKDGGVLALTVPYMDSSMNPHVFANGHCNKFNQWTLLYQLICAGFDCRQASVATYSGQLSVIVRKVRNNLFRSPQAIQYVPADSLPPDYDPRQNDPRVLSFFPVAISESADKPITLINWGDPI